MCGELAVQRLHRHHPPGDLVARAIDLAGAAAPEHALDLVGVVEHLALAEDVAGQRVDHRHLPHTRHSRRGRGARPRGLLRRQMKNPADCGRLQLLRVSIQATCIGGAAMPARTTSQVFKRKELVARLNPTCQRAFKAAADTAKLRGNPYVELAHFIEQLVLSDRARRAARSCVEAGVDPARARRRHDAGDRQAALRRHLDRGVLRPHLPRHPGGLELRLARVRRRDGALAPTSCSPRCKVPVLDGAARQDQRRVRQDRRRRDRRAPRRTCSPARSRAPRAEPEAPAEATPRRGAGRRLGAGEIRHRPDRSGRGTARSTRWSAATRRSARSSTC